MDISEIAEDLVTQHPDSLGVFDDITVLHCDEVTWLEWNYTDAFAKALESRNANIEKERSPYLTRMGAFVTFEEMPEGAGNSFETILPLLTSIFEQIGSLSVRLTAKKGMQKSQVLYGPDHSWPMFNTPPKWLSGAAINVEIRLPDGRIAVHPLFTSFVFLDVNGSIIEDASFVVPNPATCALIETDKVDPVEVGLDGRFVIHPIYHTFNLIKNDQVKLIPAKRPYQASRRVEDIKIEEVKLIVQ